MMCVWGAAIEGPLESQGEYEQRGVLASGMSLL